MSPVVDLDPFRVTPGAMRASLCAVRFDHLPARSAILEGFDVYAPRAFGNVWPEAELVIDGQHWCVRVCVACADLGGVGTFAEHTLERGGFEPPPEAPTR